MTPLIRKFGSAIAGLFCLSLVVLPLQPLWLRIMQSSEISAFGLFVATNWVGGVLILVTIYSVGRFLKQSIDRPHSVDYLMAGLIAVALLSFFWREGSARDYVVGLRYSALAIVGYFIGRVNSVWQEKLEEALLFAFWAMIAVAAAQFIVWQIGADSVASMLRLEPAFYAGDWPRLFGAMASPNHLATFLTISGLWLFWRQKINIFAIGIALALVVLTFSRSAALGMLAGLFIPYITMRVPTAKRLTYCFIIAGAVLIVGWFITYFEPLSNSFITQRHSTERISVLSQTLTQFEQSNWSQSLVGHGAGSSGPAAAKIGRGIIPENWYLQIGYEYGLIGLSLLISAWIVLFKRSITKNRPWLVAIITAMVINSLFLHPLSDNFPTAFWFYILLGIGASDSMQL